MVQILAGNPPKICWLNFRDHISLFLHQKDVIIIIIIITMAGFSRMLVSENMASSLHIRVESQSSIYPCVKCFDHLAKPIRLRVKRKPVSSNSKARLRHGQVDVYFIEGPIRIGPWLQSRTPFAQRCRVISTRVAYICGALSLSLA